MLLRTAGHSGRLPRAREATAAASLGRWGPSRRAGFKAAALEEPQGTADVSAPERDGGPTASTAGRPEQQLRLRMRPPGSRDWLVLLDNAGVPNGLRKATGQEGVVPGSAPAAEHQSEQQQQQQQQQQQRVVGGTDNGAPPGPSSSGVRAATSMAALLSTVEPKLDQMSPVDVATALDEAARLAGQDRSSGSRAALDRVCSLLLTRMGQLGAQAFAPADLARVAHSCGRLHKAKARGDWYRAALSAVQALQPALGDASMAELTRLVWALAVLRAVPPAPWLDTFYRSTQACLGSCTPGQAALTAWSLARLGQVPPNPWVATLLEEMGPQLGAASSKDLANLTWAMGTWRVPRAVVPDVWLASLYRASDPLTPSMPGEALSQLAWGLGQLRVTPPAAWCDSLAAAAAARGSTGGLSGLQSVNVMWALGQWRHRPAESDMAALASATAALCLARGAGGAPNDHSTLLWAVGRLGYLPDESWLDAWLAAAGAAMAAGRYGPPHYVTAALELGRWGVVPAAQWRDTFFRSSRPRLGAFTIQQLGNLLWGLGRVDAPVPTSWLAAAVTAAAAKLPGSATPADVGRLLGGLARLRPRLDPERAAAAKGASSGAFSGGEGDTQAAPGAASSTAAAPTGLSLWAADNATLLSGLLVGAAPVVSRCSPRELATVSRAATALRLDAPPREFVSALSDVIEGGGSWGGEGAAESLEAARTALAQLQAGGVQ